MWCDRAGTETEGVKAVLSLAVVGLGLWLGGLAGAAVDRHDADLTGVWRWTPNTVAPPRVEALLELRRATDGHLEARLLRRDFTREPVLEGGRSVEFRDGTLCVETDRGTALRGRLAGDGSTISGVLEIRGVSVPGRLERVVFPRAGRADRSLRSTQYRQT
jgi:hypothetical protein